MYKKSEGQCIVESPLRPKEYDDRNCRERCEADENCTGFDVYKVGETCRTWQLYGITGNGHSEYECYAKTGIF